MFDFGQFSISFEHLLKNAESVEKHFVAIFTRLRIKFSGL